MGDSKGGVEKEGDVEKDKNNSDGGNELEGGMRRRRRVLVGGLANHLFFSLLLYCMTEENLTVIIMEGWIIPVIEFASGTASAVVHLRRVYRQPWWDTSVVLLILLAINSHGWLERALLQTAGPGDPEWARSGYFRAFVNPQTVWMSWEGAEVYVCQWEWKNTKDPLLTLSGFLRDWMFSILVCMHSL